MVSLLILCYSHYRMGPKAIVLLLQQTILAATPLNSISRPRNIRTNLPKTLKSPEVPSEISARNLENFLKIQKSPKRINHFRKIVLFLKWDLRSPRPHRRSSGHQKLASQAWHQVNGGPYWTVKDMLLKNGKAVFPKALKNFLLCFSTTILIKWF